MDLDEYKNLKERAEQAKREADRAAGALEQTMTRIKTEFGCATLKEARAKLAKLEVEENELGREFDTKLQAFSTKWKDQLPN